MRIENKYIKVTNPDGGIALAEYFESARVETQQTIESGNIEDISTTGLEELPNEGISLIDAGSAGFKIKDDADNECVIPTGIPVTVGGPGAKLSTYLQVKAPASKHNCNNRSGRIYRRSSKNSR